MLCCVLLCDVRAAVASRLGARTAWVRPCSCLACAGRSKRSLIPDVSAARAGACPPHQRSRRQRYTKRYHRYQILLHITFFTYILYYILNYIYYIILYYIMIYLI